jgi:hypothetical protein
MAACNLATGKIIQEADINVLIFPFSTEWCKIQGLAAHPLVETAQRCGYTCHCAKYGARGVTGTS